MKVRTLEQLLNVVFLGCISAILLVACAGVQDTPSGDTTSRPPPEPVASGQSAARSPVILEEAVSRTRTQQTAGAGVAANRSSAIGVAAIEEVFVGDRITITQDSLPVEAQAGEELWIIATPSQPDAAMEEDTSPGTGAMLASFLPEDDRAAYPSEIPLPLKHTDVHARIVGYVGTVDVTQQFENPFDRKIEAVYVFPLPEKAAVSEFVMSIGERRIRGILREREEAEAIYAEARAQGYQASLLVQHRPNIFEQKVANIEPGHRIDVNIRYFHTLAYRDGWYSFDFPTVVGPRFNPPGSTDPVAALPRIPIQPNSSGVAVQYLRPGERSGHDIGISVELDAGVEIEAIEASHFIDEVRTGDSTATITLANRTTIPNRDFVLDFKVAGGRIKSNLMTYEDPDEPGQGYFTMMLFPPAQLEDLARHPVEMVFVLDCSGSMNGVPIAQAKSAVVSALDRLESDDTFQVIRFSDNASRFGHEPVAATAGNIELAKRYVQSLDGVGGTMMIEGIRAALDFPHDPGRLRFVTFLTDGYIGNEAEILREIHGLIGESRIFSFGVGSSVNRYLLERMAIAGRGAVAYLDLEDSGADVMNDFFERISHPALSDVNIRWGDMRISEVYPSRLPDLFVGRPVVVTGKYRGELGRLYVGGRAGGERIEFGVQNDGGGDSHSFLPQVWARLRIADLMDRRVWATDPYGEFEGMIRQTALDYELMSDYTAFVAVDASQPTSGDHGVTVVQPVPVPAGVRYETTVR